MASQGKKYRARTIRALVRIEPFKLVYVKCLKCGLSMNRINEAFVCPKCRAAILVAKVSISDVMKYNSKDWARIVRNFWRKKAKEQKLHGASKKGK